MEIIQTIFDQIETDIHEKLRVLEKQMVFILSANQKSQQQQPNEDFLAIKRAMDSYSSRLSSIEEKLRNLEKSSLPAALPIGSPAVVASAGLEGLLMKPLSLPSPALSARSENHIVQPIIQRQVVIAEEEAEPDDDAIRGVVAEEVGGLGEEEDEEMEEEQEEEEEEQQEEEEQHEEEEEGETIELEEFVWKGKTYFKTPDHMVYRANEEGDVEDDPFAKYDPKTNTLKRIQKGNL